MAPRNDMFGRLLKGAISSIATYEGKTIKGKVETVLSRGRVVIENGECLVEKGSGEFVKRGECVKI